MAAALEVYAFLDKKQDGAFPVFDVAGAVVARIEPSVWRNKFTAYDASGGVLCTGRPVGFSRAYEVSDAGGSPLLEVRSGFWNGKKRTVTFPNGVELVLQGESWPSRDWNVTDPNARVVLSIVATAGGWSFHPDAYAVQVADPNLTLAHVVGIVQANRMLVKASRAAAAS